MKEKALEPKEARRKKVIPEKYKEPILKALSFFPELKDVRIRFKLVKKYPVPYGTRPTIASLLKPRSKRKYIIALLEEADEPVRLALFKNLSEEKQVAVIAHELTHVLQFDSCSVPQLLRMVVYYPIPSFKRKIERAADMGAIQHGFGQGLYNLAIYQRSIPGYTRKRPELIKNYLKPNEILKYLNQMV